MKNWPKKLGGIFDNIADKASGAAKTGYNLGHEYGEEILDKTTGAAKIGYEIGQKLGSIFDEK